jgi:hypothetical protein
MAGSRRRHNFLPCPYNNISPDSKNMDAWITEVKYRSYDIAREVWQAKLNPVELSAQTRESLIAARLWFQPIANQGHNLWRCWHGNRNETEVSLFASQWDTVHGGIMHGRT